MPDHVAVALVSKSRSKLARASVGGQEATTATEATASGITTPVGHGSAPRVQKSVVGIVVGIVVGLSWDL
jgi:hypothetical protein